MVWGFPTLCHTCCVAESYSTDRPNHPEAEHSHAVESVCELMAACLPWHTPPTNYSTSEQTSLVRILHYHAWGKNTSTLCIAASTVIRFMFMGTPRQMTHALESAEVQTCARVKLVPWEWDKNRHILKSNTAAIIHKNVWNLLMDIFCT